MANLFRLGVAVVLALVAVAVHALPKQPSDWYILVYTNMGPYGTASAACAAYAATRNANPTDGYTVTVTGVNQTGATARCGIQLCVTGSPQSCQDTTVGTGAAGASCPANSTGQGDECVCASTHEEKDGQCRPKNPCPAGQHEEGGACVPDNCKPNEVRVNSVCVPEPPCPAGETRVNGVCKKNGCESGKDVGNYDTNGEHTTYICVPEGGKFCSAKVNPSICVTFDGHTSCSGTARLTGSTCGPGNGDGSNPNGPTSANPGNNNNGDSGNPNGGNGGNGNGSNNGSGNPGSGGTGGNNGGNNGGNGNGNNTPNTNPGTQPNPNSPNNPHPPIGGGPSSSGMPTPKPVPPDTGGNCPEGYTKQGTSCIKNPTAPNGDGLCPADTVKVGSVCVYTRPAGPTGDGGGDGDGDGDGDSVFSGSCLQGFVCEGDAIQCAMAREQHRRACKLFEDESDHSKLYYDNMGKQGDQTKDLPGNSTESMSGKVNQADLLGGGAGVQDLQVTVHGQSISLPFSKINGALQVLGNILLAVSFLAAVRIIGRG